MSYKKVVIIGGGPIGLLCAIQAKQHFSNDVTIVEKREDYSRLNVPILRAGISDHLKKIGVADKGWGESTMPLNKIEQSLWDKASTLGIVMYRGYVVSSVIGLTKKKNGRFKNAALFVTRWNNKAKAKVNPANNHGAYAPQSPPQNKIDADLLVIASGGGASADPVVLETLGFEYEKLEAKNYGAYGIFEEQSLVDTSVPETKQQMRARTERKASASAIAGQTTHFRTPDHNYLLVTLSGISESDFSALQSSTDKLSDLLTTLDKAMNRQVIEEIKEVRRNVGLFKIEIQRARQFYSSAFPAVLVGDAAVTPHPDGGSGIETGYRGFEEFATLLVALKATNRSKDNSFAYQSFNDRYELHVSKKAVEGTANVVKHLLSMLETYRADMERGLVNLTNQGARNYVQEFIDTVKGLFDEMHDCMDDAVAFKIRLTPGEDFKQLEDWDSTVGTLWRRIDDVYARIVSFMSEVQLLDERLDVVKSKLPTNN